MGENIRPLVSVIMATYNRSNVMRFAIQSLLKSEYTNWELIVVSDASTDDTPEIAVSFGDERIKLIQLPINYGVQSGPNNEGLKTARGKYIAYLNHDDLWFPDHLSKLVEFIELKNGDWVVAQGFSVRKNQQVFTTSSFPENIYSPFFGQVPATLWLIKKEVLTKLGGWRMSNQTILAPSQDLLIRAFDANYKIIFIPSLTAILFPSGDRKNCYLNRDDTEQEYYFEKMSDPVSLKILMLEQTILNYSLTEVLNSYRLGYLFFRLLVGITKKSFRLFGVNPVYLSSVFKFRRKGTYIKKLRKSRGLSSH